MASTITAASLTVKITEAVTLNGYDYGSQNTLTIDSINEVFKRSYFNNNTIVYFFPS